MKKILIVFPDSLDITSIKQIFKVICSKNCVFIVEDGNDFAVNDGLLDPALDGLLEDIRRSGQKIPVIHIGSEGIRIAFEEESTHLEPAVQGLEATFLAEANLSWEEMNSSQIWRVKGLTGEVLPEGEEEIVEEYLEQELTERERKVLSLVSRGMRNKEIAELLCISERTINFHMSNILKKLGVRSRLEAVVSWLSR